MTQTSTEAQGPTYYDTKITAVDCDQRPAHIEVTASVGEFAGVVLAIKTIVSYESAELTIEQVDELVAALTAARAILTN